MAKDERALAGKIVLVTGAAKRLGRATALAAARNGADVAITYLESERAARGLVGELAGHGGGGFGVPRGITGENSVRRGGEGGGAGHGGNDVVGDNVGEY